MNILSAFRSVAMTTLIISGLNAQTPSLNTQVPNLNTQAPSLNIQVPSVNALSNNNTLSSTDRETLSFIKEGTQRAT